MIAVMVVVVGDGVGVECGVVAGRWSDVGAVRGVAIVVVVGRGRGRGGGDGVGGGDGGYRGEGVLVPFRVVGVVAGNARNAGELGNPGYADGQIFLPRDVHGGSSS